MNGPQSRTFPHRGGERSVEWFGTKGKADKSIAQGDDLLIEKRWWPDVSTIHGNDLQIMSDPMMEYAFQRCLELHTVCHPTVFFSLCSATRPYSVGRKWARYVQQFEPYADLVVHSNGGLIPLQFEGQFPYLNYDAHGESKYDKQYIECGIRRMQEFFTRHKYQYALFNFRPNLRNAKVAEVVGSWAVGQGLLEDYCILPNAAQYKQAQDEGFADAGYKMYPDLWPCMFDPMLETLKAHAK